MGRMTSHISWKIKTVPNHQPEKVEFFKGHDLGTSFSSYFRRVSEASTDKGSSKDVKRWGRLSHSFLSCKKCRVFGFPRLKPRKVCTMGHRCHRHYFWKLCPHPGILALHFPCFTTNWSLQKAKSGQEFLILNQKHRLLGQFHQFHPLSPGEVKAHLEAQGESQIGTWASKDSTGSQTIWLWLTDIAMERSTHF